jgi:non-ribosomal peptide synthetase component F
VSSAALLVLDIAVAVAALISAWFWWVASRHRVRRISRNEVLDAADVNRIVTALNRTQILNSRAALATASAATLAALRIGLGALPAP